MIGNEFNKLRATNRALAYRTKQQRINEHFGILSEIMSAKDLNEEGIPIDLLVFLSGNHPVAFMPEDRPANVQRVLNILASGSMKAYGVREYAENVRLPEDTGEI